MQLLKKYKWYLAAGAVVLIALLIGGDSVVGTLVE
jgi:hypothetical protein